MRLSAIVATCIILLTSIPGAYAEQPLKVGQAELIRNEVLNIGGAQRIPVNVGDEVVRDEILRTSADSNAKISLIDDTKLSLGPGSTLKIDRAVYSGEKSYREIAIKLTAGTFRFVTGHSEKKSYVIETPTAIVGVRGTVLDIKVEEKQTLVSLQNGQASVCAGGQCVQLLKKGHTANVLNEAGVVSIKRELVPSWTFASVCATNAALCGPLLSNNPLKKANLNDLPGIASGGNRKITLFCPDGTPMTGGKCGGLDTTALGTTPLLNNPVSPALNPPAIGSPVGRSGLDVPQNTLSSTPRLSLPGLRR